MIPNVSEKEAVMEWYFVQNGERVGPLTDEAFSQSVSDGTITATTLVWNETMDDWCRQGELSTAPSLNPCSTVQRDGICGECGNMFPNADMVTIDGASICTRCRPIALQRKSRDAESPDETKYAGFWIRFSAKFIDFCFLLALNGATNSAITRLTQAVGGGDAPIAMFGASLLQLLINLLFGGIYVVYFLGSRGATLGKMACGLRVVMADGGDLSYTRAFARHLAEKLSFMTLMMGYVMAAFDSEKRALHDHICSTRVIIK